jgi:hypothetical protein
MKYLILLLVSTSAYGECKLDSFMGWPTTIEGYNKAKKTSKVKCRKNYSLDKYKSIKCTLSKTDEKSHPATYIILNDKRINPTEEVVLLKFGSFFKPKLKVSLSSMEKALTKKLGQPMDSKWSSGSYSGRVVCGKWRISINSASSETKPDKENINIKDIYISNAQIYDKVDEIKKAAEKKKKSKEAEHFNREVEL